MRAGVLAGSVLTAIALMGLRAVADAPALYTASQASAGGAVFAQQCATCHGANLEGVAGPALKGPVFHQMAAAQNLNAQSLLMVISQSMPQDNPGSLTPPQYAALVAFILQQNGYPAGAADLSADTPNLKDLPLSQ
ncbi:MAG TPA: cytochrome c [Rhizomicrobium sp.]|jgi:polar amino acid transport system substrate-binding protein|nr:cytochrome c [Rhizomicrobium sp.]